MSITSTSASLSLHALFVAFLLLLSTAPGVRRLAAPPGIDPLFYPLPIKPPSRHDSRPGGGKGGGNMPLPAAQGQLPDSSPHPFVPPQQVRANEQPILELPPALDIPPEMPNVRMPHWGDPLAAAGVLSGGRGTRSGIGDARDGRGGIGAGRDGMGSGPGPGGGGIDGIAVAGRGGVTAPRLIYKTDPEYSEDARKAKFQGVVVLRVVVDEYGAVRHVEVSHSAGLGLDERAMEAVRKWRFQPGRRNGQAVPVWAVVEVSFRLL